MAKHCWHTHQHPSFGDVINVETRCCWCNSREIESTAKYVQHGKFAPSSAVEHIFIIHTDDECGAARLLVDGAATVA